MNNRSKKRPYSNPSAPKPAMRNHAYTFTVANRNGVKSVGIPKSANIDCDQTINKLINRAANPFIGQRVTFSIGSSDKRVKNKLEQVGTIPSEARSIPSSMRAYPQIRKTVRDFIRRMENPTVLDECLGKLLG